MVSGWMHAGTARTADLIVKEHRAAMQRWAMSMQTAITVQEQQAAWVNRPDAKEFGRRMWVELAPSLREEWTLQYTAWLLEVTPYFAGEERGGRMNRTPVEEIRRVTEQMHLKSPQVGRLCLALTAFPEPPTLALVEKIEKENPDPKVQGQAAMALALLLKHLGDDRAVMEKRLNHLRNAIIKSVNVKVGDTSVQQLADDELYAIKHLSKGRVAPNILGSDAAGVPLNLSTYRGKVVVLVFWNSGMRDAQHAVDMLTKYQKDLRGRPVELLGVCGDSLKVLKDLKKNGIIPWRNFSDPTGDILKQYRVKRPPLVWVLDQKGVIQFIGMPGSFVDLAVEALLGPK